MWQKHKTKQEGIFTKHVNSVLDLISGHQTLLKQRLDQLCNSLTSVKTDVEELKASLSFTQNNLDQRFSNISSKVQSLEKKTKLKKRGTWCYTNNGTTMGIENSQKISAFWR